MTQNKQNKDENYFDSLSFLQSDESNIKEDKNKKSTTKFSGMTLDKLNIAPDMNKAVHAIMTEQPLESDLSLVPKSQTQQMLESPEMNKKLRTQNQYNQIISGNLDKKELIKQKDLSKVLFQDNFDVNRFKSESEKKKILVNEFKRILKNINSSKQEVIVNDKRQKIYRVKKKKVEENKIENKSREKSSDKLIESNSQKINLENNTNNFRYIKYISFTFFLTSLFLFRKKINSKLFKK